MQLVLTRRPGADREDRRATSWRRSSPIARVRALRDANDPIGFSRALWKEMAELGWVGIPFPEAVGGAGLGLAELAVVLEALGRTLAPEPFLSTVLLAGPGAARCAAAARRSSSGLAAARRAGRGDPRARPAGGRGAATTSPRSRRAPSARAPASGSRARRSRCSTATSPTRFVVAARTAGGRARRDGHHALPRAEGRARASTVTRQARIDGRNAALVRLDGVEVGADDALGAVDARRASCSSEVVDRATAGLCAEMLGGMAQAFALTVEHLKTPRCSSACRSARFQALKHRAANVFIEIELARSAVMAAARAVDAGDARRSRSSSRSPRRAAPTRYVLVANEGVQMFGGVGMTDEYDIGFYMKRARAAELTFGDAAFHRDALGGARRATERAVTARSIPTERMLRACRGEPVDRPPVWLMRQAGRYLPEYRARARGQSASSRCAATSSARSRSRSSRSTWSAARRSCSSATSSCRVLGHGRRRSTSRPGPVLADAAPHARRRSRRSRLARPARDACPTCSRSCAACAASSRPRGVPLIGFAGAPFTLARYLVEGQRRPDARYPELRAPDARGARAASTRCSRGSRELTVAYLNAQIEAGAQVVQLFDTWAGALDAADYERFVLPVTQAHRGGRRPRRAPLILFVERRAASLRRSCWNPAPTCSRSAPRSTSADAARRAGRRASLQGNLDPAELARPRAAIFARVREIAEAARPARGLILNLGHGCLPDTPVEGVRAFTDAARALAPASRARCDAEVDVVVIGAGAAGLGAAARAARARARGARARRRRRARAA